MELIAKAAQFESTVKTKGYQTRFTQPACQSWFESTVKTKGNQTLLMQINQLCTFECTVKTKGYQTRAIAELNQVKFESTVKTKVIKHMLKFKQVGMCLRVLLVHKVIKRNVQ